MVKMSMRFLLAYVFVATIALCGPAALAGAATVDNVSSNGAKCEGIFDSSTGRMTEGKKTFSDGTIHDGKFDKTTGKLTEGRVTSKDKKIQEGKFDKTTGKLTEGKIIFPSGTVHEGKFDKTTGKLTEGRVTSKDGTINEGGFEFSDGKLKLVKRYKVNIGNSTASASSGKSVSNLVGIWLYEEGEAMVFDKDKWVKEDTRAKIQWYYVFAEDGTFKSYRFEDQARSELDPSHTYLINQMQKGTYAIKEYSSTIVATRNIEYLPLFRDGIRATANENPEYYNVEFKLLNGSLYMMRDGGGEVQRQYEKTDALPDIAWQKGAFPEIGVPRTPIPPRWY